MIYLAYDGSVHGDWVSRYAVRLAANSAQQRLRVVYVEDGGLEVAARDERFARINAECVRVGVSFDADSRRLRSTVLEELLDAIPAGRDSFLVSATRARPRSISFLAGTVAEQLLRANRFNVLAIHVAQPGLLGAPRDVVLPLAGHPRGLSAALPFLRLFAPDVANLHVLLVKAVSPYRLRPLSLGAAERLRAAGEEYLRQVERALCAEPALRGAAVDVAVAVSNTVAQEIVNHANRTHARLIFMGASERSWSKKLLTGEPIETVLRATSSDVAIYRGVR